MIHLKRYIVVALLLLCLVCEAEASMGRRGLGMNKKKKGNKRKKQRMMAASQPAYMDHGNGPMSGDTDNVVSGQNLDDGHNAGDVIIDTLPEWMEGTFLDASVKVTAEPTSAPTAAPTSSAVELSTPSPTSVSQSVNGPTTSSSYEFSTGTMAPNSSPMEAIPIMDAATRGPTNPPVVAAAPTNAPSAAATATVTSTLSPVYYSQETNQPTAEATVQDTATMRPTVDTLSRNTPEPTVNGDLCRTEFGFFGAAAGDQTILSFAYELETVPAVQPESVLSNVEESIVNSLLPVVFPYQCGLTEGTNRRILRNLLVVGVSSVPDDEITTLNCAAKLTDETNCAVVDAKLSVFSNSGIMEHELEDIITALETSMANGDFVDQESGIVRVSFTTLDGKYDEAKEETVGDPDNVVSPAADQSQSMRLGFALSAVAALALLIVASAYRRKKRLRDNDNTTVVQDGLTLNGLSRFDAPNTPHADVSATPSVDIDPISDGGDQPRILNINVASLSPTAQSILASPYTKVNTTEEAAAGFSRNG